MKVHPHLAATRVLAGSIAADDATTRADTDLFAAGGRGSNEELS